MFKFIRKKIFEGIIKDLIQDLPKYKEAALAILAVHKDEVLNRVKDAILAEIKKLVKEKLDK